MAIEAITISPATRAILIDLAAQTGQPATELLDTAVEVLRRTIAVTVPGVNPADVWEAATQADAGQLTSHADVFAKLRGRQ